jgi:hypothetical protein
VPTGDEELEDEEGGRPKEKSKATREGSVWGNGGRAWLCCACRRKEGEGRERERRRGKEEGNKRKRLTELAPRSSPGRKMGSFRGASLGPSSRPGEEVVVARTSKGASRPWRVFGSVSQSPLVFSLSGEEQRAASSAQRGRTPTKAREEMGEAGRERR